MSHIRNVGLQRISYSNKPGACQAQKTLQQKPAQFHHKADPVLGSKKRAPFGNPFFPHITVGFLFSCLHPARLPSAVPSAASLSSHLTTTHLTQLISHTTHLTQLISHTTHLNLTTTHLTHNSSHTQLISHNSSQLISHNSSHATHLTHNSSHTQLISHTSSHRRVAWQARYSEPPEGAAARIVAGWAAALLCVAGAVHRGF